MCHAQESLQNEAWEMACPVPPSMRLAERITTGPAFTQWHCHVQDLRLPASKVMLTKRSSPFWDEKLGLARISDVETKSFDPFPPLPLNGQGSV